MENEFPGNVYDGGCLPVENTTIDTLSMKRKWNNVQMQVIIHYYIVAGQVQKHIFLHNVSAIACPSLTPVSWIKCP